MIIGTIMAVFMLVVARHYNSDNNNNDTKFDKIMKTKHSLKQLLI